MIKAIFLDAAGTLIHPSESVGEGYSRVAGRFGVNLVPESVNLAFKKTWKSSPPPSYPNGPSDDDDRSWWRNIVQSVFAECLEIPLSPSDFAEIFEAIYAYYARPDSWGVFPEVESVITKLTQMGLPVIVVSNFDPRLRKILSGHDLTKHFHDIVISSEVGSYKPDSQIFLRACKSIDLPPSACLHVGDDPQADLEGAESAGLLAHLIKRPEFGLESIFQHIHFTA